MSEKGPASTRCRSEAGQILLIVVLASVISLTVGLAAISRSVTNNRVSTEESNSQKALSAAEAGVEEQINKINSAQGGVIDLDSAKGLSNKSEYDAEATEIKGPFVEINNGQLVDQDEGADIWLSNYPDFSAPMANSTLTIFWNASDTNCDTAAPAIEVALISGALNNPNMSRFAVDSCGSRRGQNGFTDPNNNPGCTTSIPAGYNRRYCILVTQGRIARVIPLYNDAKIAVASTQDLPAQGYRIDSTGQTETTVRKVRVFQGFPRLPVEFFPYSLFVPR